MIVTILKPVIGAELILVVLFPSSSKNACIRIQIWRIYMKLLDNTLNLLKNAKWIYCIIIMHEKSIQKKKETNTPAKVCSLKSKPCDPYGHGLLVLIHHIQHWVFGASSVVGTHQSTLATKNVDRIAQGCSHKTETLRWNAAPFVPSVALYIIHLQLWVLAGTRRDVVICLFYAVRHNHDLYVQTTKIHWFTFSNHKHPLILKVFFPSMYLSYLSMFNPHLHIHQRSRVSIRIFRLSTYHMKLVIQHCHRLISTSYLHGSTWFPTSGWVGGEEDLTTMTEHEKRTTASPEKIHPRKKKGDTSTQRCPDFWGVPAVSFLGV